MTNVFTEGNLQVDFSAFATAERFDGITVYGLKAVDFVAESESIMFFIEIKDYQNPKSPEENRKTDLEMLKNAKSEFCMEMGMKFKDSLLRLYANGRPPVKQVKFLLFINLDEFAAFERGKLKAKISGYIPTGLNGFGSFNGFVKEKPFELINSEQLGKHGIICTVLD
jgi:hypothetical protein